MAASKNKNLILVHTGDGKGKTTAALGLAMRTVAHGGKAVMVQFIKSAKDYHYGEGKLAGQLKNFDLFTMGAGFTWETQNRETDLKTCNETWEKCKQVVQSGDYDLVIWDEINYVIGYQLLSEKDVLEFLKSEPPCHVVLTGRNASEAICQRADLVTEMVNIKHPYREQGIRAQKGVEW